MIETKRKLIFRVFFQSHDWEERKIFRSKALKNWTFQTICHIKYNRICVYGFYLYDLSSLPFFVFKFVTASAQLVFSFHVSFGLIKCHFKYWKRKRLSFILLLFFTQHVFEGNSLSNRYLPKKIVFCWWRQPLDWWKKTIFSSFPLGIRFFFLQTSGCSITSIQIIFTKAKIFELE